jgi:hypothetical protein
MVLTFIQKKSQKMQNKKVKHNLPQPMKDLEILGLAHFRINSLDQKIRKRLSVQLYKSNEGIFGISQ